MPADYTKISEDISAQYRPGGPGISRVVRNHIAGLYADRGHFIFELLQNAEDALRRHQTEPVSRIVSFELEPDTLIVSHYGIPFTPDDVQYICDISERNLAHETRPTDIGHFGIGFKSVYAFTDHPEIHSGEEHFIIENCLHPKAINPIPTKPDQTVFRFPFQKSNTEAYADIRKGLSQLDSTTLLFLREIEQVTWQTHDGTGGAYTRKTKETTPKIEHAREVTIVGQTNGQDNMSEVAYLVFDRDVFHGASRKGCVEVAYRLHNNHIEAIENAKLSVFFPTIVHTHFGAILQGPFRTTPSRDNIPHAEQWNKHLVDELALLLPESVRGLRALGVLNAQALLALPIDHRRFESESLFAPLYNAIRGTLINEPLIPCRDGQYYPARETRLGRTQGIRELLSKEQLRELFSTATPLAWVVDEITHDRTRQLHDYLISDIGIPQIDPESIMRQLNGQFLEAQPLDWMIRLYEFLNNSNDTTWRVTGLLSKPIIRINNGKNVVPYGDNKEPNAYLQATVTTEFPTIHADLCKSPEALKFFERIGLTRPDIVDDVIKNLLPRFHVKDYTPSNIEYDSAFARIHEAFETDSVEKKKRLAEKLRKTPFLYAREMLTAVRKWVIPSDAYIPTERVEGLFKGIKDIWLIDMAAGGMSSDKQRLLLRSCGANECLCPVQHPDTLTGDEKSKLRRGRGAGSGEKCEDYTLRDLDKILDMINQLPPVEAAQRARLLWESLGDIGKEYFHGKYSWSYHTKHSEDFSAYFIKKLCNEKWVPKDDGSRGCPSEVVFETISPEWPANPFLQRIIQFKPRIEEELAKANGLEPALIDLLKLLKITTKQELLARLPKSIKSEPPTKPPKISIGAPNTDDSSLPGSPIRGTPTHTHSSAPKDNEKTSQGAITPTSGTQATGSSPSVSPNARQYYQTYVMVSPNDDLAISESEHAANEKTEKAAIAHILETEPSLKTTPPNNAGFDLYEGMEIQQATRYIEVKSCSGPWATPVTLSHTQFLRAQKEGSRYWLYVVENTNDPSATTIHRIQDPAGRSRYFSFDSGWAGLASPPARSKA